MTAISDNRPKDSITSLTRLEDAREAVIKGYFSILKEELLRYGIINKGEVIQSQQEEPSEDCRTNWKSRFGFREEDDFEQLKNHVDSFDRMFFLWQIFLILFAYIFNKKYRTIKEQRVYVAYQEVQHDSKKINWSLFSSLHQEIYKRSSSSYQITLNKRAEKMKKKLIDATVGTGEDDCNAVIKELRKRSKYFSSVASNYNTILNVPARSLDQIEEAKQNLYALDLRVMLYYSSRANQNSEVSRNLVIQQIIKDHVDVYQEFINLIDGIALPDAEIIRSEQQIIPRADSGAGTAPAERHDVTDLEEEVLMRLNDLWGWIQTKKHRLILILRSADRASSEEMRQKKAALSRKMRKQIRILRLQYHPDKKGPSNTRATAIINGLLERFLGYWGLDEDDSMSWRLTEVENQISAFIQNEIDSLKSSGEQIGDDEYYRKRQERLAEMGRQLNELRRQWEENDRRQEEQMEEMSKNMELIETALQVGMGRSASMPGQPSTAAVVTAACSTNPAQAEEQQRDVSPDNITEDPASHPPVDTSSEEGGEPAITEDDAQPKTNFSG